MTKDEEKLLLLLTTHSGWKLIEKYFDDWDKVINRKLRTFVSIPETQETRWLYYYSGMTYIIEAFRKFIKTNVEKSYRPKIKKKDIMS